MKTKLFAASVVAIAALTITPAMAATTTTTTPHKTTPHKTTARRTGRTHDWETVAGVFRAETDAHARVQRLRADHLDGFVIEHERSRGHAAYEVEKPAKTHSAAVGGERLVRGHGFHASVERS